MKVYIPFNSNDFNSVFTTLSISPKSFYTNRKFSFKRAWTTLLNNNENFLIGYEKPIFHSKDNDVDYGIPILLEIELDKSESDFTIDKSGVRYLPIEFTVYLIKNFKLLFRSQTELDETLFKSLKSIETKFVNLAKQNSIVIKEDYYLNKLPQPILPIYNPILTERTFYSERRLNKVLGLILGSSIACSYTPPKELQYILTLIKSLRNSLSIYLNNVGDYNYVEKKKSIEIIDEISIRYEKLENFNETIILNSDITSEHLVGIKNSKILGIPTLELIIEGLLNLKDINLPFSLRLEKLKRKINTKHNSKYLDNYVESIQEMFGEVSKKIEHDIDRSRKTQELRTEFLLHPIYLSSDNIKIDFPKNVLETDEEYLKPVLNFFINNDSINDVDTFFTNRKKILIELANYLKSNIIGFDKSFERDYLIQLLKSFDNLRSAFNVSKTSNEVLKSIAILFTSGRDIYQFIEVNEKEGIQNSLIYYVLWGSIYGAASFPKTLTEFVTDNNRNLDIVVTSYRNTTESFLKSNKYNTDHLAKNVIEERKPQEREISLVTNDSVSILANDIIAHIRGKSKIKLTELIKLSKAFKKQTDVEDLIKKELADRIKITKVGKSFYAEEIIDNGLFS